MRLPSLIRLAGTCACLLAFAATLPAQQNWRWVNMLPASAGLKKAAFGNGVYVAVGADGTIVTSPDTITWTVRRMSTAGTVLNSVAYGNGLFVAVGMGTPSSTGAGLIMTSVDGISWTTNDTVAANVNAQFSDVAYGNNLWVVSGSGQNIVYTSTDAQTWTPRSLGSVGYFTIRPPK